MTKPRMSIFGDEPEFDVSAFTPRTEPRKTPASGEVRALSEAMNFRSREPGAAAAPAAATPSGPAPGASGPAEPSPAPEPPLSPATTRSPEPAPAAPRRQPRRHRIGRTAQLNVRTTPQTVDAFYAIADSEGWLVGETIEHALAALQRELAARKP